MAYTLSLLCLFTLHCVSLSSILQYPGLVKVSAGENVSLTCDTSRVWSRCDSILWVKSDLRSRTVMVGNAVHPGPDPDPENLMCTGIIYNSSTADSGIYYCSIKHSVLLYTGNGTTVVVTDAHPRPQVALYVPDVLAGPGMSLQCVVTGAVPAEVKVSWLVGESELSGWTESAWTPGGDEYTLAHLHLPSERWSEDLDVECVVEVDGRRLSKSLKLGSEELCWSLLYWCPGAVLVIVVLFAVTLLYIRSGRRRRSDAENIATEVQYASLDLVRNTMRKYN